MEMADLKEPMMVGAADDDGATSFTPIYDPDAEPLPSALPSSAALFATPVRRPAVLECHHVRSVHTYDFRCPRVSHVRKHTIAR
jgi:hypothetical protein